MTQAGIQLYSLRDIDQPLPDILEIVHEHGFDGVEFANRLHSADTSAVANTLDDTGLEPIAVHVDLADLTGEFDAIVDRVTQIDCDRVVIPHLSMRHFRTVDSIDRLAETIEHIGSTCSDHGLQLTIHNTREMLFPPGDAYRFPTGASVEAIPLGVWNHLAYAYARLARVDRDAVATNSAFGVFLEAVDHELVDLEIDVKNVTAAGVDPSSLMADLGDRVALVHLADIARTRRLPPRFEPVDAYEGIVDLDRALDGAHQSAAEWVIFEHDDPDDPWDALDQAVKVCEPLLAQDRVEGHPEAAMVGKRRDGGGT